MLLSGCALPILGAEPDDRHRSYAPQANAGPQLLTTIHPKSTRSSRAVKPTPARQSTKPGLTFHPQPLTTVRPRRSKATTPHHQGDCYSVLDRHQVRYERLAAGRANGVRLPVRLQGPVGGVQIGARGDSKLHEIIDCRLVVGLLRWAPSLRRAGVQRLEHYSVYRPGARTAGKGKRSGHARAMAIDAARFHMANGNVLDVEADWEERSRGEDPCPFRPHESWGSRVIRGVVCEAVAQQLFQVVLTPHHDHAHRNHVHLELKPEVDWTYVR